MEYVPLLDLLQQSTARNPISLLDRGLLKLQAAIRQKPSTMLKFGSKWWLLFDMHELTLCRQLR